MYKKEDGTLWSCTIYTNAIDLAKRIMKAHENGEIFELSIVDGIGYGEKVVKFGTPYGIDED